MSKNVSDIAEVITACYPKLRKVFRNLVSIKNIPITVTQLTCLAIIDRQGELTMTDLANELSMSNQQLTKVVDALVEFEMVERICDPTNRRQILAKETAKGKHTITNFKKEVDRKLGLLMHKFSEDEMDKLFDSIQHIASYFN